MRRVLIIALASAAAALATPTIAAPTLVKQTGPDLSTKIYGTKDNGFATTGTTVYGSTDSNTGHDVTFTGYSTFNPTLNSGTTTSIDITSGFAQVEDSDWDQNNKGNVDDLNYVIMDPVPSFYEYEFSVQTLNAGDLYLFYMLTSSPGNWILASGSPVSVDGKGDTQYIFGDAADPSLSVDKILIMTTSPMKHVKQNSIQLTGTIPAVPEPGTWGLMLLGFAGVGVAMRRSRKSKPALMQVA